MSERIALLFDDQSILVFREGTDVEVAFREASEHDIETEAGKTKVVIVDIVIKDILNIR